LVAEGRFRADLYFRLGVVKLQLPPLRERSSDIVALAKHFLQLHASRYGRSVPELSPQACQLLLEHHWPGNVRELKNVIEQAILLHAGPVIMASQLSHLRRADASVDAAPVRPPQETAFSPAPYAQAPDLAAGGPSSTLAELEKRALVQALSQNAGNVSRAARTLGISRDTLRYRIEKYQLEPSVDGIRRGDW
jgi:DNA-binding NtrC family response regulator